MNASRKRQARGRSVRGRSGGIETVIGELLVTAGLLALLFFAWYGFVNPAIVGTGQQSAAADQARVFAQQTEQSPPAVQNEIPVAAEPAQKAAPLAVLHVPRFGDGWKRVIRQSVDTKLVLNSFDAGVGHYIGTAMPGGIGNFAIAAHDTGYGNSFLHLVDLRLGDRIHVQTAQGWYTYEFRNFQFVQPSSVEVIDPVPTVTDVTATGRLITLTTCNPPFHGRERAIAYGTFVGFSTERPADLSTGD